MKNLQSSSSSVARSAFKMAIGTFGSRILGLVRDILMAASFSVLITDAWLVAYRIPNLFRRLFGEGALSVSFIPLLVETREKLGAKEEAALVRGVFSLLFLLLGGFSLLSIIFAPQLIDLIAGGEAFKNIAGKTAYTVKFLRIMSFFMLFICMFAFFMALLNSRKKFFAAALAPILLNVCLIVGCLLPVEWLHIPGEWLSWMALLGGFLQMAILIPSVIKQGLFPKFSFEIFNPRVVQVIKNTTPALISMGVLQITTIVNVFYASGIENGANSWIYYADRLLELPLSLIAVSFATALLPTLSEAWAKSDRESFSETFASQFRFTLFLAIPSGIGLFMLSEPLIELLFQRGKFGASSTLQTASILKVYSLSLIIYSSLRIVNVCFYAAKKVWLPVLGTSFALIVHLIMVPYWTEAFGVQGLAISTTISGFLNLSLAVFLFKRNFGEFGLRKLTPALAKYAVSGIGMTAFLLLYFRLMETWQPTGIEKQLYLVGTIVFAAIIYFLISYLVKVDELSFLKAKLKKRKS